MKTLVFLTSFSLSLSVFAATDIKHLSPVIGTSSIPVECRVSSVLKDTPADKAGIEMGDVLVTVNGQKPTDASALSDLVGKSTQDAEFIVRKKGGLEKSLQIHLNSARPRLGAVCDLAGWIKPGVTAAGNESITIFDGPYALTASGILDKGIAFLRVRLSNDSNQPLDIGPQLFSASDGNAGEMPILSPKDVMCMLYGEKGAHLLTLKKSHKDTLDGHGGLTGADAVAEDRCEKGGQGTLHNAESEYADANAQYLATESLWPASYKPGDVADGLIYLSEPSRLPITLTATISGRTLTVQLGVPQASDKQMKSSELARFFEAQKKGASLRLTLKKGKVYVGRFTSYDPDNERVWFSAPTGMLNTISFSLETVRFAESLEQVPAKPMPGSDQVN